MSDKKLLEETLNSRSALTDFGRLLEERGHPSVNVRASQTGKTLFPTSKINVWLQEACCENEGIGKINIMWEDAGMERDDFRGLGLFGSYDVNYVDMNFVDGVLTIDADDGICINVSF